jgi:hypothetical protein
MLQFFIRRFDKVVETTKIFSARLEKVSEGITKPRSFIQGEQFEEFVEEKLFPHCRYILIKRTDNYERNRKRFSESTNDPDFLFRCRKTNQEFCVEAKYRSHLTSGQLDWAKKYQLDRYRKIDIDNVPVFAIVGLGGTSHKPDRLFLFPVRKIKYIKIDMDIAEQFELPVRHHTGVESLYLWQMFDKRR